jgi:XTP/dITP diphosphohydrolase
VPFVLASNNVGKLSEFSELFHNMSLTVVPQRDYGVTDADETGLSFIENALIKARHASQATGLPAIADDSGLVVPALGGAPGIYSARYSGLGDSANNTKLLDEMKDFKADDRAAFYVAVIAVVKSATDPMPTIAEGRWHGSIGLSPKGRGGFGYDPLFIPDGATMTAAEMAREDKQRISHRAKALKALEPLLKQVR